jgi:hypothetical protein
MSIFTSMAGGMLSQRAAKRMGRVIPNPFLRYALMLAATSLAPKVYRGIRAKLGNRRSMPLQLPRPEHTPVPVSTAGTLRTW